ncbi:hypothetical protein HU200_026123 [Digitaria exilis]|uniref:Uncharacterized protein n=1 Tax=Digitaria exilis TaxID=1010633 RepID=A0A835C457_9POAL|nr:hypothetical protein HU200_026123 [Digitaria exilis]
MGAFSQKVLRETSKAHSAKKRKKTKVQRQRTAAFRPVDISRYYGWSWPHVVGLTAVEAERRITGDCPGVYCEIVPENSLLTMCYRSGRVRVLVDRDGRVASTPRVG